MKKGNKIYFKIKNLYYIFEFVCLHPDNEDFYVFVYDYKNDLLDRLLDNKIRWERKIIVKSKEEVKNLLKNGFTDLNEFSKHYIPIQLEKLHLLINKNHKKNFSIYAKKRYLKEWNKLNELKK
jgi:hypothetical protein